MATTTTTTNIQVQLPTAPTVAAVEQDRDTTTLDENEIFEGESSSMPLGRSNGARSALTRMWEAVDESSNANNEYASLLQRGEFEGATGAFPTFPVSSLTSTLRVTAFDELIF